MTLTPAQRTIGEGIDRLVSIEITGRGVIGDLYQAARALQDAPLCLSAAARLLEKVHKGQVVILATGLPMYPWFAGEQDGPVGTATLARALLLAVGARPIIVTDPVNVDICAAALRGAGLYVRPLDDALSLPTTAAVLPFPLEWEEAAARAQALLDTLRPSALVAIERTGANEHRQYHSSSGKRLTDYCGKIDTLFASAGEREILTIGIGDGGNEIGCAAIRDSVLHAVPHAARCACPCGGTTVPQVPTDLLIAATTTDRGCWMWERMRSRARCMGTSSTCWAGWWRAASTSGGCIASRGIHGSDHTGRRPLSRRHRDGPPGRWRGAGERRSAGGHDSGGGASRRHVGA